MISLSAIKEVIPKKVGGNIDIGQATHQINDWGECSKSTFCQVESIPKGFYVRLADDSMEESTHLIVEVIKGDSVKYI